MILKSWKQFFGPQNFFSNVSSKLIGGFLLPGAGKTSITTNFEKFEKKSTAKTRDVSIIIRRYAATYYQTLKDVFWILRLKNLE